MITKDQWKQAAQISRDQGGPTKLETLVSRSLLEEQQGPPGISRPPTDLERGTARRLEVTIERKVLEKGERPKPIGHKASELEKVKAARLLQSAKAKESPQFMKALQHAFYRARAEKQQSRNRGGMER
jgi:hypothetical protein